MKQQPSAKPAAVEAAYKRLMKDRELRANIEAIRAAGSTVEYRAVDVRDSAAFGSLIDELNSGDVSLLIGLLAKIGFAPKDRCALNLPANST